MPWFPGATRDPGKNAGYRRGRASMQLAVCHFTVGRDSRALIRDQGLAAFLFPKHGPPFQFCEADAITSHACEWNSKGPGLEVERLSWAEPFTADQTRWVGEVCRWLSTTHGIPLVHHPTTSGRLPIGSAFSGFADHGGLVHKACDQHTDGWTDQEWTAAIGTSPTTGATNMPLGYFARSATDPRIWLVEGAHKTYIQTPEVVNVLAFTGQAKSANVETLSQSFLDALEDTAAVAGPTLAQVTALIDAEGDERDALLAKMFPAKYDRATG